LEAVTFIFDELIGDREKLLRSNSWTHTNIVRENIRLGQPMHHVWNKP